MQRGADHHRAKLTDADVRALRSLKLQGRSVRSLSKQFGICRKHVRRVCDGIAWSHI